MLLTFGLCQCSMQFSASADSCPTNNLFERIALLVARASAAACTMLVAIKLALDLLVAVVRNTADWLVAAAILRIAIGYEIELHSVIVLCRKIPVVFQSPKIVTIYMMRMPSCVLFVFSFTNLI